MKTRIWFSRNSRSEAGCGTVIVLSRRKPYGSLAKGYSLPANTRFVALTTEECQTIFGSPVVRPGGCDCLDIEITKEE